MRCAHFATLQTEHWAAEEITYYGDHREARIESKSLSTRYGDEMPSYPLGLWRALPEGKITDL